MTLPTPSLSPDWRHALLFERGSMTVLSVSLRDGAGSIVTPTAGTVAVTKPDGTAFASVALTVGSVSTASIPAIPSTEPIGEGWLTVWTIDGKVYRQAAILVGYIPPCLVSQVDLFTLVPELQRRVPEGQTDWSRQRDEAHEQVLRTLTSHGRSPWLMIDATDLRAWELALFASLCCGAIVTQDGYFSEKAAEYKREAESLSFPRCTYEEVATVRQGAPVIRYGARGRPTWV